MSRARITDKKLVKILRRIVRDYLRHPGRKPGRKCPTILRSSLERANALLSRSYKLSNKQLPSTLRLALAARALRIFSASVYLHEKRFYIEQLGQLRGISELYALAIWLFLDTSKEKLRTVAWQMSGLRDFHSLVMLQTKYLLKFDPNATHWDSLSLSYRKSGEWENRTRELCEKHNIAKVLDKCNDDTKETYSFRITPKDDFLNANINRNNVDREVLKSLGDQLNKKIKYPYATIGGTILSFERLFPEGMDLWFQEHFGSPDGPNRSDGHLYRMESQVLHNDFPLSLVLTRKEAQFKQYAYYIGSLSLHLVLLLTSAGSPYMTSIHGYNIKEISSESRAVAESVNMLINEGLRFKNEWERSELESEK